MAEREFFLPVLKFLLRPPNRVISRRRGQRDWSSGNGLFECRDGKRGGRWSGCDWRGGRHMTAATPEEADEAKQGQSGAAGQPSHQMLSKGACTWQKP
jgi:hypothetical protein